jgi:methionine-rich copper-binding protein CopC
VRASLLSGRVAIARASSQQRTPHHLRLRLLSGTELHAGRYRLVVRMTARDGRVTTVRRSVKLR